MKRTLAILLALLLLPTAALANSWGLKGDLLSAVMADDRWDDYYSNGGQVGNVAVMKSRYHNAIMLVMDKDAPLAVHTRAVWQPDDEAGSAMLTRSQNGFTLTYRELGDSYRFELRDGQYILTEAFSGTLGYTLLETDRGYYGVTEGDATGLWYGGADGLTLDRFSIRLLPRSMEELTRLNCMKAVLDTGRHALGWWEDDTAPGRLYTPGKKGAVPVYGAPSTKAWRASSGKASVSLKGELRVLREWTAADGAIWLHITYEVSQRTHRFGFIRASDLPGYTIVGSDAYGDISVPVRTAVETTLTDDPLVSQYAQATIPAGTELNCIGVFGDEYALVQTEIGGKEAWLFAPLKDLQPVNGAALTDVMAKLDGCWHYWAGGSMASEYLRLNADGTFYDPSWPEDGGTWVVTAYDPAQGKYWNDPPYELTLRYSDGRVNVRGLILDQTEYDVYDPATDTVKWELRDSFSLTNWEGGGGYIRIDEETVPLRDSEEGNG